MPDDPRTRPSAGLIEAYETIARASHAMLAAARADDWDDVARLEAQCRALIGELQAAAAGRSLAAGEQRRRVQLLREILAHDAEVRARAEPWLRELEHLAGAPAARRRR
ncbi:MAG: flagellar protein FliT [Burkholderiales bacterium]|jgi:flagellar protein FliT|nr:flagellar protein FliT [Burkholderiales bacterium]MCA3216807.1 flagellar protein FliT [Burkholderiales bacterium]MCA3224075.1 flagellar protein FliT [Burkholderiales bacterium]